MLSVKAPKEKGIGTALSEYLEENLRKNEIYSYGLSVKKSNSNAIKFYDKNNFKIGAEEKNALYYLKNLNAN
ncbi:MAG: GNAT family N-acetyltransferase [Ignavibacteriales bacterium]|nr:GNAT family N-acetyltransferase [Ignavibacteriales bacterium]